MSGVQAEQVLNGLPAKAGQCRIAESNENSLSTAFHHDLCPLTGSPQLAQ